MLASTRLFAGNVEAENINLMILAREALAENSKNLSFFECRFTTINAKLKSVDFEGKALMDPIESKGLWIKDGDESFYELVCDVRKVQESIDEQKKKNNKLLRVTLPCPAEVKTIRNKNQFLLFSPGLSAAKVSPNWVTPFAEDYINPFTMCVMGRKNEYSTMSLIERGLAGEVKYDVKKAEFKGGKCLVLTFIRNDNGSSIEHWLDPNRGFLPIRVLWMDGNGVVTTETQVVEAAQSTHKGWFPRLSMWIGQPTDNGPFPCRRIRVDSLVDDTRPSKDKFAFLLPRGIQLHPIDVEESDFRIDKSRMVRADAIDELLQFCADEKKRFASAKSPGIMNHP